MLKLHYILSRPPYSARKSAVYRKPVYRSCEVKLKLYNARRFHVDNEIFSCNLRW